MSLFAPSQAAQQRQLRIQLLRLQADYQRLALRRTGCQLVQALQPDALAAQARAHLRAKGLGWLGVGLQALRRYPLMSSLLGSLLGSRSRRRIALKTALITGLVWLGKRQR
ncbi:hypothetical protein ABS755_13525 [Castellaniella sp. FW104-16D08]|jgi:hypothetical protein|uniref:hypothetical protein n=1 Tax=unclassified Castellaniella TaxID=2617606 RepID=UPI0033146D89